MRALVKHERARGLALREVERPTIGPNDVLIRVRKTAICGTDLHIYRWDPWAAQTIAVPLTIGHEFAGEIVEVGTHVLGFRVGDRVSGEGHLTCGHCRNCRAGRRHLCRTAVGVGVGRAGCFADYLALPASNAFKLPDAIPDDVAAFLDPLGNATHTALSFDLVGEDVLITGAGPIGCMAAAIARHVGARHVVVTDLHDYRLELARKLGASRVVNVKEESLDETMAILGMTEGFDVGLEMSGSGEAFGAMLSVMNHGGRIALLGLPSEPITIDLSRLVLKGLVLKGIYGREIFETWYKMVSLLQSGLDVLPIVTHHFHVEAYEEAFAVMEAGLCGKVILDWS